MDGGPRAAVPAGRSCAVRGRAAIYRAAAADDTWHHVPVHGRCAESLERGVVPAGFTNPLHPPLARSAPLDVPFG